MFYQKKVNQQILGLSNSSPFPSGALSVCQFVIVYSLLFRLLLILFNFFCKPVDNKSVVSLSVDVYQICIGNKMVRTRDKGLFHYSCLKKLDSIEAEASCTSYRSSRLKNAFCLQILCVSIEGQTLHDRSL